MSLLRRTTLTGAAAALAALALGAGAAGAATTFTVKAGSAASGTTVAVKGATTGTSPQITFKTSTGTTLNCVSGTATGSLNTGTGKSGTSIASISGAGTVFNTCTGPFNLKFKVTGSGTWLLNATSGSSTGASGTLTGVSATVDGGTSCKFTVTGSVAGSYTNGTSAGKLTFPGTTSTLKISNVTGGCFGAVTNGSTASYKAVYSITATTSAYNPVTITSP